MTTAKEVLTKAQRRKVCEQRNFILNPLRDPGTRLEGTEPKLCEPSREQGSSAESSHGFLHLRSQREKNCKSYKKQSEKAHSVEWGSVCQHHPPS